MSRSGSTRLRVWTGIALVLLMGLFGTLPVAGADEPVEAKTAEDGKAAVLTLDQLEERITGSPWASRVALLSRGLAIVAGLVILLVSVWLAYDRRKSGVPTKPKTPPPALFPAGKAFLLSVVGFVLIPAVVVLVLADGEGKVTFQQSALALAIGGLPVALLVVSRRLQARKPCVGIMRAVVAGLSGFCVATALVIPAGLLTLLLMKAADQEPAAQELVSMMLTTEDESVPWTLLIFGVLVAPFTEEAIFRGLLYPAIRDAGPAGRPGVIRAAIIVSVIFAAVHRSATAALGLFCLAMVLTWIYERTNSLLAIVVTHGTNNLLSLLPLLLARYGI